MSAIRTDRLTKSFGDVIAVRNLTLEVTQGELFGLVGPDGAGKTTTMRLLSTILEPTSGDAWVVGRHIVKEAEAIKEHIGYMSQRFGLYPDLTVLENLIFYADIYEVPRQGRDEKIRRLLSFSNLTLFQKRLARDLSGGMKQKLGLACVLIHTPKVLFLDEPTNGLDPVSRREFWRILNELLREKVTIFISTAYPEEAEHCHRVALLHQGELLACDSPDEMKRLMRETILEIRASEARLTKRLLHQHFPPESVVLFGDRIHIVTEDPARTTAQTETILRQAGLQLRSIRQIEPGLEDVFLSVLGRANNAADHDQR